MTFDWPTATTVIVCIVCATSIALAIIGGWIKRDQRK